MEQEELLRKVQMDPFTARRAHGKLHQKRERPGCRGVTDSAPGE